MLRFFGGIKKSGTNEAENDAKRREQKESDDYLAFLASPVAITIQRELMKLENTCKSSTHTYPCSSDTGIEESVLMFLQQTSLSQPELPTRLLALLLQRLRLACTIFDGMELVHFLQNSISCIYALVTLHSGRNVTNMLELGLDEHILLILQFVRSRLMSRTTGTGIGISTSANNDNDSVDISPPPQQQQQQQEEEEDDTVNESETGSSFSPDLKLSSIPRGTAMSILRDTLRVLLALHVGSTPTNSSATGIPRDQLAKGITYYRKDNTSSSNTTTTTNTTNTNTNTSSSSSHSFRGMKPVIIPEGTSTSSASTVIPSKLSFSRQQQQEQEPQCSFTSNSVIITNNSFFHTSATREMMMTECGHLFLYCSKGAPGLDLPEEEEEQQMITEVLSSLALLILNLTIEPNEQIVHVALAGTGVQLARFIGANEQKEMDSLLRRLSCSLLVVNKFLRECPQFTISAMGLVYFFDNLVEALKVVGREYECAHNDEGYTSSRRECVSELESIVDINAFRMRDISEHLLLLPRPSFGRIAANDSADEFLHCYLGLLVTQRLVRTSTEVYRNSTVLRYFSEIELSIIKTFLDTPNDLGTSSCMYDTLMKYAITSLPHNDMGILENYNSNILNTLINAGLYRIIFYESAFSTFLEDPRLLYGSVYLVHYMLTRPISSSTSLLMEESTRLLFLSPEDGVDSEVSVILDVLLTGKLVSKHSNDIPNILSLFCAILLSAVHGPKSTAIINAILQNNGISIFAAIANKLSITTINERQLGDVREWVTYLLTQLLRIPEVQQGILVNQAGIALSLLTVKDIRHDAENMLISLLSHRCPESEYPKRMMTLVKYIWDSLGKCAQLETGGSDVIAPLNSDEQDQFFISILYCIRTSIHALGSDSLCWGPARQLQNILCGLTSTTPDTFLRLIHRAVLPWNGVKALYGISCIIRTIVMIIHGNPALREQLFKTVSAEEIVECFRNAWFSNSSHGGGGGGGGSWLQFLRCMLLLVYEEDCKEEESDSQSRQKKSVSFTLSETNKEETVIQNPELLVPLLRIFTKVSEFKEKHRDALEYLLARLRQTLTNSLASLWMVANAGLFESLTALIPIVSGTALLEMVLGLIMTIASHHISVRETKQFLIGIAHTPGEEARRRLIPLVVEVLHCASHARLTRRGGFRRDFIAFRERSGATGLRAVLPDFPPDGYTVSLWLRREARPPPQAVFALHGPDRRPALELAITAAGLRVASPLSPARAVEVDCPLPTHTWLHLALVHRPPAFPFAATELQLFLNGVEVTVSRGIPYPAIVRGFFFIGTRGEAVEQRSYSGTFTGQMSAVYVWSRTLNQREITELITAQQVSEEQQQQQQQQPQQHPVTLGVRHNVANVLVYVDPRFGERGQLHNLAALLRGKPTEWPLITYEGTLACNTNSIMDSICVLGALHTVVVPLLVLLVNPQLPFQLRVPPTKRKEVSDITCKAVDDVLKLVESLLLSNIVRADLLEVGLFPIISQVLQQFVNYHSANLPQRLCNICTALLPDGAIFDAAYSAFFLSGDLLHACAEKTQLMLIQVQNVICGTSTELHRRLRGLDLPNFIVSEVVYEYNSNSSHDKEMREEMFALMEAVMLDPVSMNDVDAILRLFSVTVEFGETFLLTEILKHIRILVATRSPLLAALLGRRNFALLLIPLLSDTRVIVRNEALLLFCLLVSRSRRTQELLNPTLLIAHEAVHVECDVSLSWLREKLQTTVMDYKLYETFRAALTGRFDVSLNESIPLRKNDKIVFAPVLTPLLQLMKRCQDKEMKSKIMLDISILLQQDSIAWRTIVSVPGWYASIVDVYLSEEEELMDDQIEKESDFLINTSTIFTRVIFQVLLQETYGASELELLVAYLVQKRAHILLNAVLLGVVKEYIVFIAGRNRSITGTHFGLGSQLAASNFTALILLIEDVLFYSATIYQVYGVTRQSEPQRKRGYTEMGELVVSVAGRKMLLQKEAQEQQEQEEKEDKSHEDEQQGHNLHRQHSGDNTPDGMLFLTGDTTWIRSASDGVWMHTALAVSTMDLLSIHSAILNSNGMSSNTSAAVGGSSSSSSSGISIGIGGVVSGIGGVTSEHHLQGRRLRKGGFHRLFVRLFRVVCGFTLRDPLQVDNIILLATRWVQLLDNVQGSFLLLRRQSIEQKEHSPLSGCMIMILSLHELLDRRLRFSEQGPSIRFEDANVEILYCIQLLCALQKKAFNQMQIFNSEIPSDETAPQMRKGTLEWLCETDCKHSIREFVEVASRQDYDVFISQCTLVMERDQLTDKGMVRFIEQEHTKTVEKLHEIITNLNVARKTMLDVLEQRLQYTGSETDTIIALSDRYTPQAARTLSIVTFNSVWTRFIERCKGTIWDIDPAGQHSTNYVRLLEVEQQLLIRRKIQFDSNGTNHANITPMGTCSSNIQVSVKQPLRLRGGENVLLSTEDLQNEEEEDISNIPTIPTNLEPKSTVQFSMPCEVPYMMHCWSATLMIRESELCIFFDDENKAYNQRIAEEAESYLIKPRSIIYPSGHAAVLAPGRRFRMRRSALELWFRDGRSVLINFATVSDMRAAVSNVRTAAERHKIPYLPLCVFQENAKKESLLWRRMEQWRDRDISNFEYLIWLNFFGGRTVNDLTQYPVFPWVIADYTSEQLNLEDIATFRDFTLPIGICGGPNSRARVEMRYEETKQMGDVPAHYFTHYSSPAVALYYMIRLEPYTTLQIILQGGHFDHADRMFHSMAACWYGVKTNSQDVRELVPELYYLPELCMNTNRVNYGYKQDGRQMDSLELPPWAHGDPYEFVYRMREALECDYVSSMLHHWIDLIFGYKQRGKEAITALNVFNWHSYEELDKNRGNDVDEKLLIDSLDNIGQTPIQLFTKHHVERRPQEVADPIKCPLNVKLVDVSRLCSRVARVAVLGSDRVLIVAGSGAAFLFRISTTTITKRAERAIDHNNTTTTTTTTTTTNTNTTNTNVKTTVSAGSSPLVTYSNMTVETFNTPSVKTPVDSVPIPTTVLPPNRIFVGGNVRGRTSFEMTEEFERRIPPFPPGVVPSITSRMGGPCETENIAVLCFDNEVFVALGGLFDNTFVIRPLDSSSTIAEEHLRAHRGRVIRIAASSDSKYVVTGGDDTMFIVWSCHLQHGRGKLRVDLLFTVYGHEDNPTAVDINTTLDIVATASKDGVLLLHGLHSSRLERSLRHPKRFAIDRVLIQASCYLPNILYTSMTDNVIHQISMNGVIMRSIPVSGRITSWCTTPRQYILITTAPFTKSNSTETGNGVVIFLHSFYLSVLRSIPCSLSHVESTLSCCSSHPLNPQVIVCGSTEGSLSLLRVEQ